MGIKRSKVHHNLLFDLVAKTTALIVTAFNPVKASVNFVSQSPLNLMYLQFSSVAQSLPTLCDPMDCSMPGIPVHHQLPKLAQTHVHRVSDAIQPSHPLLSPSPPAFNLSKHQGLFRGNKINIQGATSIGASASVLPVKIQDWFPSGLTCLISLQSKGLSSLSSNTTVQKHQLLGAQLSL